MIQDQDGTSRATYLEAGHKLCTYETEKSETVVARRRSERNQRDQLTDIAPSKATDEKSENTCRRRECRRLERERQRCDVLNRWRCGDKEKAKTFGKVSLARIRPSRIVHKMQVEQFPSFADEDELALVADDEVDAATVQYLNMSYSQGRPVSDREVLLAGLLVLPTPVREVGRTEACSVVESSERMEKTGSDTIKTTVAKNDLV